MRTKRAWYAVLFVLGVLQVFSYAQRGPMRLRVSPPGNVMTTTAPAQPYHAYKGFFRGIGQVGGEREITSGVRWNSGNTSIATVTPGGSVSGVLPGQTTISASAGPLKAGSPLDVSTTATLLSVSVIGPSNVPLGRGAQYQATANYSDGFSHDVTSVAAWSSGTPTVLSVNSLTGHAQSVTQGPATVTANFNTVSGSTNVTVGAAELASRLITPLGATLDLGSNQQFRLIDAMSDGTLVDQTNAVPLWTVSDTSVARVGNLVTFSRAGFTTGIGKGSTLITGQFGTLSANNMSVHLSGSLQVTIPSPRFAYGVNRGSKSITIFIVDAGTGKLNTVGYQAVPGTPGRLARDPGNKFLYVPIFSCPACPTGTGAIAEFSIDQVSGSLTPVAGSPFVMPTGSIPAALKIDKNGVHLYAISGPPANNMQVFSINSTTGGLSGTRLAWAESADADRGAAGLSGTRLAAGDNADAVAAATAATSSSVLVPAAAPVPTGSDPSSISLDPSGKYAYVTNNGSANVSIFSLDPTTGAPSGTTTAPAGTNPGSLTLDSSGQFAYVTNAGSNNVSMYTIDASTGNLTAAGSGTVFSGTTPAAVTVDPSGKYAFVANSGSNDVSAYTITTGTGALTQVGSNIAAGTGPSAVAVDPSDGFVYVANVGSSDVSTYAINTGGSLTSSGTIRAQDGTIDIDISKGNPVTLTSNYAYVGNIFSNSISAFTLDGNTGFLNTIPNSPFPTGGINSQVNCTTNCNAGSGVVVVDPLAKFAYIGNRVSSNLSGFAINPTTGALNPLSGSPFALNPPPRAQLIVGKFLYTGDDNNSCCTPGTISGYKADPNTGFVTPVSGSPFTLGPNGGSAKSLAADSGGHFLYVPNNNTFAGLNIVAYSIDPNSGALAFVPGSPFTVAPATQNNENAIAIDSTGRFLYLVSSSTSLIYGFRIDATTGALSSLGSFSSSAGPQSIAVEPSGRFAYVASVTNTNINPTGPGFVSQYSINGVTGALTLVASIATNGFAQVAVEPSGKFAYVSEGYGIGGGVDQVQAYAIDPTTGKLSALGSFPTAGNGSAAITISRKIQ